MTAHGVTERDLGALTYLAGRLREETHGCAAWDQRGVEVKVAEFRNSNLAITIEQILRHATDPEAKTPGALHRPFSPPMPSEREPVKRGNPHRDEECPKHPGQWPDSCAACKAERAVRAERPNLDPPSPDLPRTEDVNPRLAARLQALDGTRTA